ncbi:hypothetical protein ASPWEDRAFT_48623 [Aspergillus wentii DTO 134E9]|uniref:DNA (cytosine-5-)-methyltransferase n=1 Tax=Aspergillus wentii DTO 134E9 TaxID=1073089 RepID=A0A1L9RTX3_ASPWE|nr:uncharacterized protein ASPWEDRAFT_48623 [Aspergillus wentii DTO 134E9]OJJ38375.1 hypothetical protein ASPWEDRAFT_48623 [Aspergillus wentii DTO 134E9]
MDQPREIDLISNSTHSDDASSDCSATVENDPDRSYFIEQIDLTGDDSGPGFFPNPRAPSIPRSRHQSISNEIVDLASGSQPSLNEGDYLTDECFERLIRDWSERGRPRPSDTPREPPQPQKFIIPEACIDGILYKPGQSVELYDGTFLRIVTVLSESTGSVFLRGRRLISNVEHTGTYIPSRRNELVWMVNNKEDVPLEIVKRFATINFTNCTGDSVRNGFTCRIKETSEQAEASVQYLSYDDADQGLKIPTQALRHAWRGETRPFGDAELRSPRTVSSSSVIDLTDARENHQNYTFGDGFCGAGGVSSGAHKAGLHIKWAFDSSPYATDTYRRNFESAICEQSDIFHFLTNEEKFLRVDISHGSPPCQTFSPAHTINCDRDDANSACIFSSSNLIKKAKPRVHTMEETSGLFERHKDTFHRVIQDFIEIGYSVRWAVLHCAEYGVPQIRRRLVIIASGPGEALPPFPKPTHGPPELGLKRPTTINSIISSIPLNAADHDVQGALDRGLRGGPRAPFDPNQPARTITCGGGENNYHPSGQRGFTNREFACLQTFPLEHRFGPREVRKQIGNAVPPALAKAVYGEIIKSLQKTDAEEHPARPVGPSIIEVE